MNKAKPIQNVSLFLMRVSVIHIFITSATIALGYAMDSNGQELLERKITLEVREQSIKDILSQIEEKADVKFTYRPKVVESRKRASLHADDLPLNQVLIDLFQSEIEFEVIGKQIILKPTPEPKGKQRKDDDRQVEYQQQVSGRVTDETNNPMPGVNVVVKGTTQGSITDADGNYRVTVPGENSVLVFSFIGYREQEITVGSQSTINVTLQPDVKALEEVVVIGYGTQKKSDLTGSVGTVKAEQLQERPAASLNQSLAGRVTGVWINTNSGRPGGQTNVRIRGFSSINTSNNPLYVIDGVIMPVGTQTEKSNSIDFINPADIASVEVLKDASATAIYGARGANGVILITTKRGRAGENRITYDVDFSVPTIGPNRVESLNAREFLEIEERVYANAEIYDPTGWAAGRYTDPTLKRTDPRLFDSSGNPLYDTDWMKESTQNKLSQNHQLSFSGGNDNTTYGVFLGYRDENGLLLNSYLKRYSTRFSFDSQVKDWVKIGGTLSYNNQNENLVDQSTGALNSVRMITEALPILPVKFEDGTWAGNYHYPGMEGGENPVRLMTERINELTTQTTIGNIYANIRLAEGLEFRSTLGANVVTREQDIYDGRSLHSISANSRGVAVIANNRETFWSFENYLTYNKRFADIHSITAMAGWSRQETDIFNSRAEGRDFLDDYFLYNNIGSAANVRPSSSGAARFAFDSYFGRVNYSLLDKYLLTVTGRMDGSSKFGEANKYAFFPSTALAWRISEEEFLSGVTAISNLKLRTSYGVTGNSEINTYSALAGLSSGYVAIFDDQRATGIGISRLANPDLRWEKTAQYDIGVELGLLNNRLSLEADYYYRKTTDMLLSAPLPTSGGYSSIVRNVGSMENKGVEFMLSSVNFDRANFGWTSSFNISMNRNKVLSLATPAPIFGVGNPGFTNQTGIIQEGQPVGSFWGLVRLGTWSTDEAAEAAEFTSYRGGNTMRPGDIKYLDVNDDKQINDADRMIIGNGNPDAFGSLLNTVRVRNFDFTVELQYSIGNDVLNMTKHSGEDRQGIANSFKSVLDHWTPDNQDTYIAAVRDTRAGYVTNVDSWWVEDGSFLRGRNLLLGYTFPSEVLDRISMSRLRIYASVQNFFLATEFTGNDPEVTTYSNPFAQGQTFFDYPKPTTYLLGINVGL